MTTQPFGVRGTPERVWAQWSAPAGWPALEVAAGGHAVVASPHPDDETLAVGGTIAVMRRAGWTVEVVAVTDGEASHPPTPTRSADQLAAVRRAEQGAALDLLGVGRERRHRLGLPDGGVAAHVDAVAARLAALVPPGGWLLAPWVGDGHRDHEAVGRAAHHVAAIIDGVRLWSFPVWAWHWGAPDHPAVAAWRPTRVDLPPAVRRVKAAAIACYASQTGRIDGPAGPPVVPPSMLAHHRRPWEVLL